MPSDLNFKLEFAIRMLNQISELAQADELYKLDLKEFNSNLEMLETPDPEQPLEPCFDRFNTEIRVDDFVNYEGSEYKVKIGKFGLYITVDNTDTRVASLYQHKIWVVTHKENIPIDHNGVEIREGAQVLYKGIEHTVFSGKQGLSISIDWEETPVSSLSQFDLEVF